MRRVAPFSEAQKLLYLGTCICSRAQQIPLQLHSCDQLSSQMWNSTIKGSKYVMAHDLGHLQFVT